MGLTKAQETAVTTLDRHLAVTAGPGSGKTRVLVERYLYVLEHGNAGIENIVAITFTKKAATEMRERLRRAIDDRCAATPRPEEQALWRDRKRRLESAVITTIHGFCSRILREHPVEAEVDPHFTTLDEYTQGLLLDEAVQAAVGEVIERDDEAASRLVAAYSREGLVDYIAGAYSDLRSLGVAIDDAERLTCESLAEPDAYACAYREFRESIVRGYAAIKTVPSKKASKATATAKFDHLSEVLERNAAALDIVPAAALTPRFSVAVAAVRKAIPPLTIAGEVKDSVHELKAAFEELSTAFYDACAREYTPIVFDALRTIDGKYSRDKAAIAALDYEDLELKARELLATRADVRARLLARYRYVMVDEFQDTNGLQRDIVRLLGLEGRSTNVFVVGDRKQSIYGFRGAEVEVFSRTIADLATQGGATVPLAENFRSDARLVAFQNGLFERVLAVPADRDPGELLSLGFVGYEQGVAERGQSSDGPAVELVLVGTPDGESEAEDEEAPREREARLVAQRLRDIVEGGEVTVTAKRSDDEQPVVRPVCYGDVAILFGARTNAKTYERALRKAGVPYYVVAGKGFYDRAEITDVLNLLDVVDNSSDELALAATLRSPMFGVSDDTLLALRSDGAGSRGDELRIGSPTPLFATICGHTTLPGITSDQHTALDEAASVLRALIADRNRVSISTLIEMALERTGYQVVAAAAPDGPQRLSNLDKLLSKARQYESGGARLLRDFVEYVREFRRLRAREAEASLRRDENAVAILTAHSSKGLEFPIVVLPDLQRGSRTSSTEFSYDREVGLGFSVPDGRGGRVRTSLCETIAVRAKERATFENRRLLYVAVTRAEEYLLLSGAPTANGTYPAGSWLAEILGACTDSPAEHGDLDQVTVGTALVRITRDVTGSAEPVPVGAGRRAGAAAVETAGSVPARTPDEAVAHIRAMLAPVVPAAAASLLWMSATALQSHASCPRQFCFSRLLRVPELTGFAAARDDAERAAPADALPATLRGLVVHRFCETFGPAEDVAERVRASLRDVIAARGDQYPDVVASLDEDVAVAEVVPFARNYVTSALRRRIEAAPPGNVASELPFAVALPSGTVMGAIDKLLLEPDGDSFRAVVVDFKTGRAHAAADFDVQMQAYSVAAASVDPRVASVETVLHFLGDGPDALVATTRDIGADRAAIDARLQSIRAAGNDPAGFSPRPGERCALCRYAPICPDAEL